MLSLSVSCGGKGSCVEEYSAGWRLEMEPVNRRPSKGWRSSSMNAEWASEGKLVP